MPHPDAAPSPVPIPVLLALVAGLSALLPGCSEGGRRAERPNLLLIVSDTLRADALSCYGGPADTPNLCGLAARGVLFERAYANAPWTLPSSVALFTGSHPGGYTRFPIAARHRYFFYVPDEETLLAEALRAEGYDTPMFLGTGIAARPNPFQGFSERPVLARSGERVRAREPSIRVADASIRYERVAGAVESLLDAGETPFFALLWIHDPHAEYLPPAHVLDTLTEVPPLPRPPQFYLGLGHRDDPKMGLRELRDYADAFTADELRFLRALYHKEVESVDERVGYVLRALELRGLDERTLVVFTSDHGEGFGEHGRFLHGNSLYDELVRVPLIVAGPGIAGGRRVSEPVSHVDLMPTLRELLRAECLDEPQGRSFAALLRGEADDAGGRQAYLASPLRLRGADALVRDRYKVIAYRDTGADRTRAAPREPWRLELFDTIADPREREDLAAAQPELLAEMRADLESLRRATAERRERNLARRDERAMGRVRDETIEQLRALGYLDELEDD